MLRPGLVIILLWVAFWVSWLLAAGWSDPAEQRVGMKGELAYRLVLIAGALFLLPLLLAIYATAAAKGTILGLIGALPVTLGLWMKARLEERWLREELDPGAYDDYRKRVPMLVPFGPR